MGFPILIAAIRSSGLSQWRVAQLVGMSESRLSRIVRRGDATPDERDRLVRLLGIAAGELFAAGPVVSLNMQAAEDAGAGVTHAASATA